MLFYATAHTPRLLYIVDFIGKQLFDISFTYTADLEKFKAWEGPKINYSEKACSEEEFFICSTPLLFETGIHKQEIRCFELNYYKAFFQTPGDFPFDIFAASFYLLSRYEEYLPHQKDEYGRFAHQASLAYREGFLHQPLVNIWLEQFRAALGRKYPRLSFRHQQFTCQVTYDIDEAYAYRDKGFFLSTAGLLRDLFTGRWAALGQRIRVLRGRERDPYDCFEWLDALHLYCRVKPLFFFLVAKKRKGYDRNISTSSGAFRTLIEYYSRNYKTGLHPSWQSGDQPALLKEEAEWLEVVAERAVSFSRQHYIRFQFPETFRQLMEAGIRKDFSLGYGSINGFRASVACSFPWYDLVQEKTTPLVMYPFCFMDANSFFEQKLSPGQAYQELMEFYQIVKKHKGLFIGIWHNNMLGTLPAFNGWREMFELFMKETVYWDAYYDEG